MKNPPTIAPQIEAAATQLSPVSEAIADFRAGKFVIMVDDEDRENEGDLILPSECVTPEAVSFLMNHARGLICISITQEIAKRLQFPPQTIHNQSPFRTPFTVSVDHVAVAKNGNAASSRAKTMRAIVDPQTRATDFCSPGHVFPLVANPLGVIGRQGQTEGSSDLARLAGFSTSGILCELLGNDGRVLRGAKLHAFAKQHDLKITSVADVIRYRLTHELVIREGEHRVVDTRWGKFEAFSFFEDTIGVEHLALVRGALSTMKMSPVLSRIHSECLTGDLFGSLRCDCGSQLDVSMSRIAKEGGVLLYLQQEGRGIGLGNKLKAYALQDTGMDTFDANVELGFPADARSYTVAAQIYRALGISKVTLLTNNPEKLREIEQYGIEIVGREPMVTPVTKYSEQYMETKRTRFGHIL